MAEHTPLPWAEGRHPTKVQGPDGFALADTAGVHLAFGYDPEGGHWAGIAGASRDMDEAEEEANAAFIVRACNAHDEILEAIEAIELRCDLVNRTHHPTVVLLEQDVQWIRAKARAAIAKAKGDS